MIKTYLLWLLEKLQIPVLRRLQTIHHTHVAQLLLSAKTHLLHQARGPQNLPIDFYEFRVFSQHGQDGILQHLLRQVPITVDTFVEFGVSNYEESNTRFLLLNNNWRGLVIDSSQRNIAHVRQSPSYWRHDLRAVEAFVTAENINALIANAGIEGDIGLVGIDLDGNDYWVWNALSVVRPRILICEFNVALGLERALTIPYDASFDRSKAHHSHLYFGASLPALIQLGREKGYRFVGHASTGNDAFFVREDLAKDIPVQPPERTFGMLRFTESRDSQGNLDFQRGSMLFERIQHLPFVTLRNDARPTHTL